MLRVRIGEGWWSDPGVREGLRAAGASPRRAAIRAIVDVVAIEVDGVDIAAGRTEGPLAEGVLRLLAAVDRLASGEDHASVPFDDGAVELVLHRKGGQALLSVATLARPARVLAHDVAVDLPRLAEAAREAAREFCERVTSLSPRARALPELRALLRAASRRTVVEAGPPGPPPGQRTRRTGRRRRDPTCGFELHDEAGRLASWRGAGGDLASLLVRGRVTLRAPAGDEILSVEGVPFLLFRDLAAAADRIASAHGSPVAFDLPLPGPRATLRVTVADAGVQVGGRRPVRCDPLALAQAIVEGARDFCAVVRSRAPAQARNALLEDLLRSADATRAHVAEAREGDRTAAESRRIRLPRRRTASKAPLSQGRLRRVTFRRLSTRDVGPPAGEGLFRSGDLLLAFGAEAAVALDVHTGELAWEARGGEAACADDRLAVLLRDDRLEALQADSGALRWTSRLAAGESPQRSLHLHPGGRLLLVRSGPSFSAHDAGTGERLWSFAPPGATRLALLPLGPLLLSASDTGMVHALDRAGRVAWRLRGSGPLAAPPVGGARACLLTFASPTGATIAAVDPATGSRRFETALDFAPSGPPLRFAGRIAIAGRVAGEGIVAALEEDGRPAWTGSSPAGADPSLSPRSGGLLVKGADGACAALDRDGAPVWAHAGAGGPPPPGNLPPVEVRGLVAVPSEEVELLDAATGTRVGRIPAHAPSRLLVGDDLSTWALDADGLVTGVRLGGHLALVERPGS